MLELQISSMDSSVQLALLMLAAVVFSDLVEAFLKTAWQTVLNIVFWIRYTTSFEGKHPELVCYMDRDIFDHIPSDKLREMKKKSINHSDAKSPQLYNLLDLHNFRPSEVAYYSSCGKRTSPTTVFFSVSPFETNGNFP